MQRNRWSPSALPLDPRLGDCDARRNHGILYKETLKTTAVEYKQPVQLACGKHSLEVFSSWHELAAQDTRQRCGYRRYAGFCAMARASQRGRGPARQGAGVRRAKLVEVPQQEVIKEAQSRCHF